VAQAVAQAVVQSRGPAATERGEDFVVLVLRRHSVDARGKIERDTMAKATPKTAVRKSVPTPRKNGSGRKERVSELGRILQRLADQHVASGAKLLNRRELEREIAERRGLR
jgi:hypothetical protein